MDRPPSLPLVILLLSAGYLAFRLGALWLRVSRSRRAYSRATLPGDADDRILGCLEGLAAGDSVGLAAESLPGWLIRWRYPGGPRLRSGWLRWARRRGDISDDTQLTIAVARSVLPGGEYNHERFVDELRNFRAFAVGAGPGTFRAASALWERRDAAPPSHQSDGNGVAIRVAPLALSAASDEQLLASVALNAAATHGGSLAIAGARMVALLIRAAQRGELPLHDAAQLETVFEVLARRAEFPLARYREARSLGSLNDQLKCSGTGPYVLESLSAVLLLLSAHGTNLKQGWRAAFFAGGDVDSVCSIYGAVVGAAAGRRVIPDECRAVSCRKTLPHLAAMLGRKAPGSTAGRVTMIQGDVARQEVDVVVNAWNRNLIPVWLLIPQGVSRAMRRAGGQPAFAELSRMPALPWGGVVETLAYGLPAKQIVHAAGINLAWTATEGSVKDSMRSSLLLARYLGARSVALPLIGAGSGRLGVDQARVIVKAECERAKAWFDELRIVEP